MLSSITPLGERGRAQRWGLTATAHLVGSTLGGAVLGALAGLLGLLVALVLPAAGTTTVLVAAALVAGAGALLDALPRPARPPSWHRQVDETWLGRYRGWVYGGGFGVQLGFGVVTIVTTWSVYAFCLLVALTGSVWVGALLGAVFGVVRAAPVLAMRKATDARSVSAVLGGLARRAVLAQRATVGVLAACAVGAVFGAVLAPGGI